MSTVDSTSAPRRDRARAAALTRLRADAERVRRLTRDLEQAREDLAASVALAREVGVQDGA